VLSIPVGRYLEHLPRNIFPKHNKIKNLMELYENYARMTVT